MLKNSSHASVKVKLCCFCHKEMNTDFNDHLHIYSQTAANHGLITQVMSMVTNNFQTFF